MRGWARGTRPLRRAALALALAVPAVVLAAGAGADALLTLAEADASVIVGASAVVAVPGMRLPAGAIVETAAATLRVEWPDGSVLDLGPATRVMLRPPGLTTSDRQPALFYLLQGWAKQSLPAALGGQLSAAFDLPAFKGVIVSHVEEGTTVMFVESGSVQVLARHGGGPAAALRTGDSVVLTAAAGVQVLPRPPAGWLQKMPRSFRDTIAPRAARFKGPAPEAQPRQALTYSALQPWLGAEPALRRDFPARFAVLARDRTFRDAVAAHLGTHPEWQAVLVPPRPASAAR